jgi:hypothetical protein
VPALTTDGNIVMLNFDHNHHTGIAASEWFSRKQLSFPLSVFRAAMFTPVSALVMLTSHRTSVHVSETGQPVQGSQQSTKMKPPEPSSGAYSHVEAHGGVYFTQVQTLRPNT